MPRRRPAVRLTAAVTETLEQRRLLAAPQVLDVQINNDVPAGKPLYVPLRVDDADGDSVNLTLDLVGDNAGLASVELLPTDNTFIEMNVEGFGSMTFQLYDEIAPETVRRISGLANAGYYDGLTIFRVIDDFVLQFGDPTENGQNGDPIRPRVDYSFDDEFDPDYLFTGDGQLAMANGGKDTNSSQFFVTEGPKRAFDGNFTLFGQLVRGFGIRDAIIELPTPQDDPATPAVNEASDRPINPPIVSSVRVVTSPRDAVFRITPSPTSAGQSFTLNVTATDSNGDTSEREFVFDSVAETENSPAVLVPLDDNRVTAQGEAIVFSAPAADPEGNDIEYVASFNDLESEFLAFRGNSPALYSDFVTAGNGPETTEAGVGTVSVDDEGNVTFTPEGGFTGQAEIYVYARDIVGDAARSTRGNNAFPFDKQLVTIGVGELGAAGQARTINGFPGQTLNEVVVATFEDLDASGTAANWSAVIDWGDGRVDDDDEDDDNDGDTVDDDGPDNEVFVRATSTPGVFEVVGTHTYEAGFGPIPITVTVTGDRGAELVINSEANIRGQLVALDDGILQINGSDGDDEILIENADDDDETDPIVRITVNGESFLRQRNGINFVEIVAGAGNDTIIIDEQTVTGRVFAGAGNDTVTAADGNDEIFGEDGDDVLRGGRGNDSIVGGAGNDYLRGDEERSDRTIDDLFTEEQLAAGYFDRDTLIGETGNDTLSGGLDQNLLRGGPGDDLLNGSGSRDTLDGGEGNDTLRGYGNSDLLVGGDGADTLLGDAADGPRGGAANGGPDTLEGGNGDDVLRGLFGDDFFRGGTGNDALFGGDGDDTDEDREAGDIVDSIEFSD